MSTIGNSTTQSMLDLIRSVFWGGDVPTINIDVINEMRLHAIATLAADVLLRTKISPDVKDAAKSIILQQLAYTAHYRFEQDRLPLTVPYVVLKGTSAAQYYPNPHYRTMGDIDIMTRREDYDAACSSLTLHGYKECAETERTNGRHRSFHKSGIEVEVHAFFALLNDPKKAELLDDLIIDNINNTHVLPDNVNGLTLLEHIAQHMEGGLGLRQIIDWMMFAHQCLQNEEWPLFRTMARSIGLETLAIVVTKMCKMYLGLPGCDWCENADEKSCVELMDYVLSCGNFGQKQTNSTGTNVLVYARKPIAMFYLLQDRGLANWNAAKKHKFLRPFAWAYQIIRYVRKGIGREAAVNTLVDEYETAKKRSLLFDKLNVKQTFKGIAVYQNGKYQKSYQRPFNK